ncbi:hypothetical protein MGAD_00110 [Mycolicibacterium gadium]|uniref:Flavoprotein pyridine nucleotide cytochrome reductase-like FAD-binding domain-containing protein n=1 Tax=Mycolicibacterium gadium TaxID=1794 RepID=A0A7I7WDS1_MYCGU|nr:hypothetical protein MGAD_00110 [Mycolicibacterium gadium]
MRGEISFAHPDDGRTELEFIIRLLPDGEMSNYVRDRAKPGDRIALRCSKGFYLRPIVRPVILVAGGTGLSAILAMAQSLDSDVEQPVHLLYGVTAAEDLCKTNSTNSHDASPASSCTRSFPDPTPGGTARSGWSPICLTNPC